MTAKRALILITVLLLGGTAMAVPLQAELIMGENSSWRGTILNRDGDWIEFNRDTATRPMRVGIDTIRGIEFRVQLNGAALVRAM